MAGMNKQQMAALAAFCGAVAKLNNVAQALNLSLGALAALGYVDSPAPNLRFLKSNAEIAAKLEGRLSDDQIVTQASLQAFAQVAAGAIASLLEKQVDGVPVNQILMQRLGGVAAFGTGGVLIEDDNPLYIFVDLVGKTARMAYSVAAASLAVTANGIPALKDEDLRLNTENQAVRQFEGFTMADFAAMAALIQTDLTALHSPENKALMVQIAGTKALGAL